MVVSDEYHFDWHEEHYHDVEPQLIISTELKNAGLGRELQVKMKVQVPAVW